MFAWDSYYLLSLSLLDSMLCLYLLECPLSSGPFPSRILPSLYRFGWNPVLAFLCFQSFSQHQTQLVSLLWSMTVDQWDSCRVTFWLGGSCENLSCSIGTSCWLLKKHAQIMQTELQVRATGRQIPVLLFVLGSSDPILSLCRIKSLHKKPYCFLLVSKMKFNIYPNKTSLGLSSACLSSVWNWFIGRLNTVWYNQEMVYFSPTGASKVPHQCSFSHPVQQLGTDPVACWSL